MQKSQYTACIMMNLTKIKIIILLWVVPHFAFAERHSTAERSLLTAKKTVLTVAIGKAGYFPFNYREDGDIKGFSVELLNYIEKNSNFDFEFIILPWPRALHLVSQGNVDIILTLFKTPTRNEFFHFIEPSYGDEVNQLYTLADSDFKFTGQLQQLVPYSIGTIREYSYGEAFDRASDLNKLPALTEEVLLKLLLNKRVDMLIANALNFNDVITKANANAQVKAIKPYIEVTPMYMALSRKRKDALAIKQALGLLVTEFKNSAQYQELKDKYQLNY